MADRHETKVIPPGTGTEAAESTRRILQDAINSMPAKAAKLAVKDKGESNDKMKKKK